jgi:hypothetical protein
MNADSKYYTLAEYDLSGELTNVSQVSLDSLASDTITGFQTRLARLSGDLELPLESSLPGEFNHIDYRVGSDLNGAYVLYYLHDEVLFASLLLRGQDEDSEIELTQIFRFLLLDTEHLDEPTEEVIEAVLASSEFDFDAIQERPAAFSIRLSQVATESRECEHIAEMDRHLAAAFLFGSGVKDA